MSIIRKFKKKCLTTQTKTKRQKVSEEKQKLLRSQNYGSNVCKL